MTKTSYSKGILLLILITVVWGTVFPLLKSLVTTLSPAVIVAIRFTIAASVFTPWLQPFNWRLLRDGTLLASLYFAECSLSVLAVETISANRLAFIASLYVILVPLLGILLRRLISHQILAAAGLAIAGIGLMSWETGGLSQGDGLAFGCALSLAVYILVLERVTSRHPTLPLVATQLGMMAVFSLAWAGVQWNVPGGTAASLALLSQGDRSMPLLYLGLIVTALPIWLQAVAQRWVPAPEAALIYTLEPVFAAVFSFWFLGEQLMVQGVMGAILILIAMLLSQWRFNRA